MTAREEVLRRVREALGRSPDVPSIPREYRMAGSLSGDALVALLVDRLVDYRATVLQPSGDATTTQLRSCGVAAASGDAVAAAVREVLPEGRVLHAPGVPQEWLPEGVEVDSGDLGAGELDQVAAVVTGSVVAIAQTGTIVLDGSPLCGRRALSLVPDVHVCLVRRGDVVETVPEGLARLDPTRPLTLVSGPSATSDIELTRVEGVHGPRTLIVVIV